MTHFRTYCIGEYDETDLWDRFSEQVRVEPYIACKVDNISIIRFLDYYTNGNNKIPSYGKKLVNDIGPKVRKFVKKWEDADFIGDNEKTDGIIKEIIETVFKDMYNCFGEDWNSNRWKFNDLGELDEWSTYNPETVFDYFTEDNETTLGEIADPVLTIAEGCGFFKDNEYTRFDDVGWFGFSESVVDQDERERLVREAIDGLSPDTPIYIFDCHI